MSEESRPTRLPAPERNPAADARWAIGLLLVVLAAHGISLWDGLFFDDHWHRAAFRNHGWSPGDLVESATIDLSGKLNHLWWQERPAVWRYPRPMAMLLAKVEFVLSGGNAMIIHAFALGWHWIIALLVYRIALLARLDRKWAFCAGVMFILLPHSFFSLGWMAARNAVVGAFFFAAAVATYMSASLGEPSPRAPLRYARESLPIVLWACALLSRETAIIFAAVILLIDISYGGWRHLRNRIVFHAPIWILTAAFIAWRLTSFNVGNVPQIYFAQVSGPASLIWAASKMLQMLFSQIFYTPMLMGLATYQGVPRGQWLAHTVMALLVGLVALWYIATSKGRPGRWLWPLWMVGAFVPVLPVFAMPHFSYLPSIPYAIVAAIMLAGVAARWRKTVTVLVIGATVWSLFVYRVVWWGIVRSEQIVYTDMQEYTQPPPPPGSTLFFINLPIAAIYAPDAMREAWNRPDLEGYTLTFAPHPLMMRTPSIVEQLNDRELLISTDPPGYFSGMTGKMLLDGMRPDSPLTAGTTVKGDLFDVTVVKADETGLQALRFSFHRPLQSADCFFYVSSPERGAYRLRFDKPVASTRPGPDLFQLARSAEPTVRDEARVIIRDKGLPVAVAMASPIQRDLLLDSDESLSRAEAWWAAHEIDTLATEMKAWRSRHRFTLRQRELYFKVMEIVAGFVESDLYMTGKR